MFKTGKIEGVRVTNLVKFVDERGWLVETFRQDELEELFFPVMGYISMTNAGVARGPHEHVDQADHFAFLGPSNFKVYLWDNRKSSPTYMVRQIVYAGEDAPKSVIIPAGIVHAYKNVGGKQGMVVNSPNRLFAGSGKTGPVDEVRHEDDPNSMFKLD
ncbi:MAG: dTDP-4-dehydrorhamnose 3,5-epimerase family protein [Bacteroidetes bacterium]|nr:dTDP-4-dehydrorhamnose 3,5-epimerase family protein [Bacteroidota bacterium]MCW5895362.1 dTDP-4-dehydrorhamnose 3,5-epimerase family protein [Bacteroidota bacterium]